MSGSLFNLMNGYTYLYAIVELIEIFFFLIFFFLTMPCILFLFVVCVEYFIPWFEFMFCN